MKTLGVFSFFAVSFLAVPSQVFGQIASSQYCPNPATDFFKGSIHYENGEPWIETVVDPDWERDFLRGERKIGGDIPLTPVYNLVVRIKPEFNYYCIPGWAGNTSGGAITADKLPETVPIDGFILAGKAEEVVINKGTFTRTNKKDDQGRFMYEWKIKGWYSGVARNDFLLKHLVEAVGKNEPVNISLVITKNTPTGSNFAHEKSSVSFGLCAPIWGGGEHKIISMTRVSDDEWFSPVFRLEGARQLFAQTQPYKKYQNHFSYFADLSRPAEGNDKAIQVGNTLVAVATNVDFLGSATANMHNNAFMKVLSNSACGDNGIHLAFVDGLRPDFGIATLGSNLISGAMIDITSSGGSSEPESNSIIAVHEYSHAGPGLNDEYEYKTKHFFEIPLRNCSSEPSIDYLQEGRLYGATKYSGCSFPQYSRPSSRSLMNSEIKETDLFNVVSCGHILGYILGGDAKSYFPECSRLPGVIKDGITAQKVLSPVFARFNAVISQASSLTAQVGSSGSTVTSGARDPYLIVESFNPADLWGGVIEVDSDTSPITASESGTIIKDPIDDIFADFEPASFPIFDPELFDAMEQELLAGDTATPTLWERFKNLFSSDDTADSVSGGENLPQVPLVSAPTLLNANGVPVEVGGSVASGKVSIRGIITVPKDSELSEVKSTFQYASGAGDFIEWVSFSFPDGLQAGDVATDTYTWQAGAGEWRFRLCMDSKEQGRTCGEATSVSVVGSLPQASGTSTSCATDASTLTPATPTLSGFSAGSGRLKAGMMKVSTNITNTAGVPSEVTSGRFEYSKDGMSFTPWVTFSVPVLSPCAKSSTSYSWEGGEGMWFMRACVGTTRTTCSAYAKVEVI